MSPLSLSECRNSHFTNNKLKVVCGVLDLEKKGTHSDLVDRILTFLIAPKNSGKVSSERAQTHCVIPVNHVCSDGRGRPTASADIGLNTLEAALIFTYLVLQPTDV